MENEKRTGADLVPLPGEATAELIPQPTAEID